MSLGSLKGAHNYQKAVKLGVQETSEASTLKIAGIVISAKANDSGVRLKVDESHREFLSDDVADATYTIHCGEMPQVELGEKVFDSGGVWRLFQSNGKLALPLTTPVFGPDPYRMAVLEPDFTKGDIFINNQTRGTSTVCPFEYPMDEVLMVNLLARGRGIEIHGCGLIDQEEGLMFVGCSGAGKSTMANLWRRHSGITILSDDRLIIRQSEGQTWLYGTPWHGDARVSSPERTHLKKIFFLKKASRNSITPLRRADTATRLLVCSFPTFYDRRGMEYTVNLCDQISASVPAFELGVLPEDGVIDFIRQS